MADKSNIEWTDATWTPIRARHKASGKVGWHCTHATPGCVHCYAEDLNKRLGTGLPFKPGHAGEIEMFLDEEMLFAPLRWKKPRMIFVCSMTDLFADFVPDEVIDKIFAVMALTPQHTYQVLTKRSARMRDYVEPAFMRIVVEMSALVDAGFPTVKETCQRRGLPWQQPTCAQDWYPLRNVWKGASCEDQRRADERIPDLLATPAAVRFVSAEPLLGPIQFRGTSEDRKRCWDWLTGETGTMHPDGPDFDCGPKLDWIIVGGESGREARPMHPDWARQIRDQCAAGGTAFFFKQWGEWQPREWCRDGGTHALNRHPEAAFQQIQSHPDSIERVGAGPDWVAVAKVGKKRAGRLLDGVQHDAMPETRNG